jgi:hypothetical protein
MTDITRAPGHASSRGEAAPVVELPKEVRAAFPVTGNGRPFRASESDATDPEVPNAKRKRDARRRRSFVLIGGAVLVLVLFVLFLIWKTGRQVTTQPPESSFGGPAALSVERKSGALVPSAGSVEPAMPAAHPVAQAVAPSAALSVGKPNTRRAPRPPASSSALFRQPGF